MASAKIAKAHIPVFVFLDENVFCAKFEKLKSAKVPSKYKLKIIPFPSVMRFLGIFDFQVSLFLKKVITSRQYGIRQVLYGEPHPIFVFVTSDLTFVNDAEKGFESWKGDKKRKHQNRDMRFYRDPINTEKDAIIIKLDSEYVIKIAIRYIKGGSKDTEQIQTNKIIKSLESFLI